jgi:nicotine blue oxidoreductase
MPDDVTAVVVALADQPLVGAEAVRRLSRAHQSGAGLAVATYEGRPRNPTLLGRDHWPGVLAVATGDVGARAYLRGRSDVEHIPCDDTGSPADLDTPADLPGAG